MVKKILFPILAILWMGLIFFFSSQTGEESGGLSGEIVNFLINLFYGDKFNSYPIDKQEGIINAFSIVIRKGAHFTIFGFLGLWYFLSIYAYKKTKLAYLGGILLTFLYASFDEWHQTWTNGRAGMFTDVLIDTSGALVFLGVTFLVIKLIKHYNCRDSKRV